MIISCFGYRLLSFIIDQNLIRGGQEYGYIEGYSEGVKAGVENVLGAKNLPEDLSFFEKTRFKITKSSQEVMFWAIKSEQISAENIVRILSEDLEQIPEYAYSVYYKNNFLFFKEKNENGDKIGSFKTYKEAEKFCESETEKELQYKLEKMEEKEKKISEKSLLKEFKNWGAEFTIVSSEESEKFNVNKYAREIVKKILKK